MIIDNTKILTELNSIGQKLVDGYETLLDIEEVDVATTPKTKVWQSDHVSLYRYDRDTPAKGKIPCLVSFALMNLQTVLDIEPERSLMRKLLNEGLDLYIMDWGYPTRQEQYLTMEDYTNGYFNDAID